jgi:hypothetical protein
VTLVLDAGALLALERNDRAMWRRLQHCSRTREVPLTHGAVIGQVWRGRGSRQALLAKALAAVDVRPLSEELGRRAGELLGRSGTEDVVDAALMLLTADGDAIVTSDPDDLDLLAEFADRHIELIPV